MDVRLTPLNVIALAKSLKDADVDEARSVLSPGKFQISAGLRILGTLSVGHDYESQIVAKANPWALLAMALNRLNGVTIDGLVRSACESPDVAEASGEIIKAQASLAIAAIKAKTITTCRGRITTQVAIEVMHDESGKALQPKAPPKARRGKAYAPTETADPPAPAAKSGSLFG